MKDDLIIKFTPRENDPKAILDLHYDVILAPKPVDAQEAAEPKIEAVKEQKVQANL